MKRYIFILLSVVFSAGLLLACSHKSDGVLRVGMELAYPPFETKDDAGAPSGLSVALAKDLANYLHEKLVIENIAWNGLVPALQTGKIDAIISSFSINKERSTVVDFSQPYIKFVPSVLARKNSGLSSDEASFNRDSVRIALRRGTAAQSFVQENLPKAKLILLDDATACVVEVMQGKADAFIYDTLEILRLHAQNPDSTEVLYLSSIVPNYGAVAVKKGNTDLLIKIDSFLADYKKQGGFDTLGRVYLQNEQALFGANKLPWWYFGDVPERVELK